MEYDALVAALRFLVLLPDSSAMTASCLPVAVTGESIGAGGEIDFLPVTCAT
jgi:hypothetical protein